MDLPEKLSDEINKRIEKNNFRTLAPQKYSIDFFSNDYLGYAGNKNIKKNYQTLLKTHDIDTLGSTGSRLISGNHKLFDVLETKAKTLLNAEAALFFNSGYEANIGLLSAVLKPKDVIFYDELCHASIRDGLQLSKVKAYKFKHSDYEELVRKIENQQKRLNPQNIYIITESVFSMDGDESDIARLIEISRQFKAYLIVDEAHALGVCGKDFKGLSFDHSEDIFARIYTCGKSLGTQGGFILGSKILRDYLVNFSRPFIYTTAASPYHVAQVIAALNYFEKHDKQKNQLQDIIAHFKDRVEKFELSKIVSTTGTAIQTIKVSGNSQAKVLAGKLQNKNIGVKAILYPTVPKGQERIRICLHSFNTKEDIESLLLNLG